MNINYYQSIPELGIRGRMNTPNEFKAIGLPEDLSGQVVLDIGCNIGAFLVEAYKRKARWCDGVEPNLDWRLLANGIAEELNLGIDIYKSIEDVNVEEEYDLVLLLSITHVVERMTGQEILDKAYKLTKEGGLLIVEINDRLQKEKGELVLPKEAVLFGKNKDNRSVYHIRKNGST